MFMSRAARLRSARAVFAVLRSLPPRCDVTVAYARSVFTSSPNNFKIVGKEQWKMRQPTLQVIFAVVRADTLKSNGGDVVDFEVLRIRAAPLKKRASIILDLILPCCYDSPASGCNTICVLCKMFSPLCVNKVDSKMRVHDRKVSEPEAYSPGGHCNNSSIGCGDGRGYR